MRNEPKCTYLQYVFATIWIPNYGFPFKIQIFLNGSSLSIFNEFKGAIYIVKPCIGYFAKFFQWMY